MKLPSIQAVLISSFDCWLCVWVWSYCYGILEPLDM